jgi:hypothetical protein
VIPSTGEDLKKLQHAYIASENIKWLSLWKADWCFFKNLNICSLYNPGFPLIGIYYPRRMKSYNHRVVLSKTTVNEPRETCICLPLEAQEKATKNLSLFPIFIASILYEVDEVQTHVLPFSLLGCYMYI